MKCRVSIKQLYLRRAVKPNWQNKQDTFFFAGVLQKVLVCRLLKIRGVSLKILNKAKGVKPRRCLVKDLDARTGWVRELSSPAPSIWHECYYSQWAEKTTLFIQHFRHRGGTCYPPEQLICSEYFSCANRTVIIMVHMLKRYLALSLSEHISRI